jgi:hypothetical protein
MPPALSPADFGKLIADETEKWAQVVKFAGSGCCRSPGHLTQGAQTSAFIGYLNQGGGKPKIPDPERAPFIRLD